MIINDNFSILVVDDEPDNFDVIEALLLDQNYTLQYANCGQQAIAAIDRFEPDVILLDAMMPDLDGLETCQRIKSTPQWQSIPIIMVTAISSKENLANCLAAGADDFIAKPVHRIELLARIKSMLRIKKQHDRIQSLSKLQRNNIHSLENNLNELRLDLAVGFPTELNIALNGILESNELMQNHFGSMSETEIQQTIAQIDRSTLKLDKLHQTFLFYLQLTLAVRDPKRDRLCAPKMTIEQIATLQADRFKPSPKLIFDLEDTEIAVTPQHLQYIVTEVFDCAVNVIQSEIHIHGRAIDNAFHFWIDSCQTNLAGDSNSKLSELIQFNSGSGDDRELSLSLKIVKKIVEIYDGLFLIANNDRDNSTIYVILPLAMSPSVQQPVMNTGI
jgi:two-component system, sensor histidine kinase and response regulator